MVTWIVFPSLLIADRTAPFRFTLARLLEALGDRKVGDFGVARLAVVELTVVSSCLIAGLPLLLVLGDEVGRVKPRPRRRGRVEVLPEAGAPPFVLLLFPLPEVLVLLRDEDRKEESPPEVELLRRLVGRPPAGGILLVSHCDPASNCTKNYVRD